MEFLLYIAIVIFILSFFITYPLVAILRSDDYVGWRKVYAFLIVLATSWIGYFILKIAAKNKAPEGASS